MPPPCPAASTAPPCATNVTTSSSSTSSREIGGFSTTRSAARVRCVVVSAERPKRAVRRRSMGRPRRTMTRYNAWLPSGPLRYVDARRSGSAGFGVRFAANTATPIAVASSRTSPISSRYDMLRQLIRRVAERAILELVARHGAEEVAVQRRHQAREGRASGVIEVRFAHVLGGSLGGVEADGVGALQVE